VRRPENAGVISTLSLANAVSWHTLENPHISGHYQSVQTANYSGKQHPVKRSRSKFLFMAQKLIRLDTVVFGKKTKVRKSNETTFCMRVSQQVKCREF